MGIYYRKTKKLGPLNVTASKSGLGASVGFGPFRVGKGADGRKSVSARTGIKGLNYRRYF
ncbi:DUF4236 domain-containing protein [Corynebacterium glucuronolyticum]|uniref:DUF4236 domain-containing protein n=1 Tax=Corynebacterium glucuronolyticum TaxID=39791 RepID=A0AAX1L815_9CORY|nr:DUF4236 domain-containing protein [Corynebacterium glucuronolyticum]QRP70561.1 DUF4236 domain-containing protein [Corynebacterium glucuronolyticum]